jgi:hypothetical protein
MRKGVNPRKLDGALSPLLPHRIISPVYAPTSDGFFAHAPEVLKLFLDSLIMTTRGRASLTIICNAATPDVRALLHSYERAGLIDQLIVNSQNRGKLDAILAAARGSFEPFITFTDSDVLFRPGWLQAIDTLFDTFPEAGFVSPVPNPTLAYFCTSTTILSAWLRGELSFERVVPELDLWRFAHSIERPGMFGTDMMQAQMVIRRNGAAACVGAGHFVFTIRREMMDVMPIRPSLRSLSGDSQWLDRPVEQLGAWRLATTRAYAYHMGNVPEPWMYTELGACRIPEPAQTPLPAADRPLRLPLLARVPPRLRSWAVRAIRKCLLDVQWQRAADRAAALGPVEAAPHGYAEYGEDRR